MPLVKMLNPPLMWRAGWWVSKQVKFRSLKSTNVWFHCIQWKLLIAVSQRFSRIYNSRVVSVNINRLLSNTLKKDDIFEGFSAFSGLWPGHKFLMNSEFFVILSCEFKHDKSKCSNQMMIYGYSWHHMLSPNHWFRTPG